MNTRRLLACSLLRSSALVTRCMFCIAAPSKGHCVGAQPRPAETAQHLAAFCAPDATLITAGMKARSWYHGFRLNATMDNSSPTDTAPSRLRREVISPTCASVTLESFFQPRFLRQTVPDLVELPPDKCTGTLSAVLPASSVRCVSCLLSCVCSCQP